MTSSLNTPKHKKNNNSHNIDEILAIFNCGCVNHISVSLKALPTDQQTDQTGSKNILLYFYYSLAIVLFLLSLHISCK